MLGGFPLAIIWKIIVFELKYSLLRQAIVFSIFCDEHIIVTGKGKTTLFGPKVYCLIKKKIVRCCVKDNQAHVVEQGGMAFQHQPSMGPLPGSHPSAPTALQLQAPPLTHNMTDIENSLARMQLQYSALASQLASQKTDQKTPGASGAPRLNQYPMV